MGYRDSPAFSGDPAGRGAAVAVSLAAGWGVDLNELEVADTIREEVRR